MPTAIAVASELLNDTVRCPSCGGDSMHLEGVVVHQDRRLTVVGRAGAREEEAPVSSGRGSVVEVRFACEVGHRSSVRYRFHKGRVFFDEPERPNWEEGRFPETLWRD